MHPSSRWLTAGVLISLSLGCSARGGGGGNITPFDSGTEGDSASPGDLGVPGDAVSPMDQTTPPTDDGVPPTDTGKTPVDNGFPPVDNGFPPTDLGQPVDVGTPPVCGDARCNGAENCMTCASDCGACAPTCGDHSCNGSENCTTCPTDCGTCAPVCGDGACSGTETCSTCSRDCGACAPVCGDGTCNGTETCSSCPSDCGVCPANCAAIGSCGACTSNPACGWCTFDGACQAGTSSGPSVTSSCSIFGGWVRNATSCTVDSGVRDTGTPDTGAPPNITATCTTAPSGLTAECGWRYGTSYTCTPGTTVTIGCTGTTAADAAVCSSRLGSCSGDPMIRACAGSGACSNPGRLAHLAGITSSPEDDTCGTCPLALYTCPSAGQITVYVRAYNTNGVFTCTLGRL